MKRILVLFLFALTAALPALGSGGLISVPVSLLGGIAGTLMVGFDNVSGLTASTLGVSVNPVSLLDTTLRSRLPSGVSIPLGIPILVHIEPSPTGGLLFNGITTVQFQALSLLFPSNSPRMYAASNGGKFTDMTTGIQSVNLDTSYRVIGTRGGFSEFLIVSDPRPVDTVVAEKLDSLDQILADNSSAISATVAADLASELAAARAHVAAGNPAAAVTDLNALLATVAAHSGTDIPDVWRATRDLTDVAGLLTAGAQTLQFELRVKQGLAH
jgi:hypothetical protein